MLITDRPRPRNPGLAAFLSFLFPGLGQAYVGNRRLAILFATPVLLLLLVLAAALILFADRLRNEILSTTFLSGLLVVNLALLATTVGMHAWIGVLIGQLNSTLDNVFAGDRTEAGGETDIGPLNQPDFRWDGTQRIGFLLLGVDSGVGRDEALTDAILVVSIDPVAGTAVMVSVPRDTGFVPLPDRSIYPDGLYPKKINELSTEAGLNPARWCPDLPAGVTSCGLRTLQRAIGLYLGVPIQ